MRKFFRKKSKRVSTKRRTKIERKVREHNRKVKKEGKNNPTSRKKVDGSIPNQCPFKEEVLKEAEDHKKRLEEEREIHKERRKKNRQKAMSQKRNLEGLVQDAQKRTTEYDRKNEFVEQHQKDYQSGKNVELSLKQYYREFKKVIEAADVVLQVLDARDPLGSRCPQVEEAVLGAGPNKRIVLLLNKVDLIPRENVEKWLEYLRREFPTVAFKASTQSQSDKLSRSKVPLNLASDNLRKSSQCLGAEVLLKLLGNYCRNKNIRTSINVGVVGFPNTGKSSIINSLKRSKACSVGATPGVTKSMQLVQLDKHVKLLDSPGIVMATGNSDSATILRNCVKVETVDDPVPTVEAILRRCTKHKLMMQYGLPDFSDVNEFLALLATKMGKLKKGGLPDVRHSGRSVIHDWNQGCITYYTEPPESPGQSPHVGAQIVTEMSREFDVDSLLAEEKEVLQGLKQTSTTDVVVVTEGPTDGLVDSDQEEEEEAMEEEDIDTQYVVPVNSDRSRKSSTASSTKVKEPAEIKVTLGEHIQLNKARKQDFKKMKKQRKRADVVSKELSSALEGAFGEMDANSADGDDNYNFETDF